MEINSENFDGSLRNINDFSNDIFMNFFLNI